MYRKLNSIAIVLFVLIGLYMSIPLIKQDLSKTSPTDEINEMKLDGSNAVMNAPVNSVVNERDRERLALYPPETCVSYDVENQRVIIHDSNINSEPLPLNGGSEPYIPE